MSHEATYQTSTLTELGFPGPPHKLCDPPKPSSVQVIAIAFLVALLAAFTIALGILFFGYTQTGRALLIDSALALGLGEPLPDATVEGGRCDDYRVGGYTSFRATGWNCPLTVIDGSDRVRLEIDVSDPADAGRHRGAGRVLGSIGLYWPADVLLIRWLKTYLIVGTMAFLVFICALAIALLLRVKRTFSRLAPRGTVRPVDLLRYTNPPCISFVDDRGRRRFHKSDYNGEALLLDGALLVSAALVWKNKAAVLLHDLYPLDLTDSERRRILDAVATHRQRREGRRRVSPAILGGSASPAVRLDAIANALADNPRHGELSDLYREAWYIAWHSPDAETAHRAFLLRDAVAARMDLPSVYKTMESVRSQLQA